MHKIAKGELAPVSGFTSYLLLVIYYLLFANTCGQQANNLWFRLSTKTRLILKPTNVTHRLSKTHRFISSLYNFSTQLRVNFYTSIQSVNRHLYTIYTGPIKTTTKYIHI